MAGMFIGVIPPETSHRCELPFPRQSLQTYTVWQCDCGKAYRLEAETQFNESFRQWKRYAKADASDGQRR